MGQMTAPGSNCSTGPRTPACGRSSSARSRATARDSSRCERRRPRRSITMITPIRHAIDTGASRRRRRTSCASPRRWWPRRTRTSWRWKRRCSSSTYSMRRSGAWCPSTAIAWTTSAARRSGSARS